MSDLVSTMQLLKITSHRCMVDQVENKRDYRYKVHNGNVCYKGNNTKVQTLLELMKADGKRKPHNWLHYYLA